MPARLTPLAVGLRHSPPGPALRFGVDTFAFRNDSRIHHRGKPDLYASWCFVLARAVVQFQRFAHFEPGAPRLAAAEYTALVQRSEGGAPETALDPPALDELAHDLPAPTSSAGARRG